MEWNNLIILLALLMQITFANTASVDTESISYFNPTISSEKSDPDDPVPIPLQSTSFRAASQPCDQQGNAQKSTSEKCSAILSDAQKGFQKIATKSFPEFNQFLSAVLKGDDDFNNDCPNSKGEFPTKVENDVVLKHQWAIENFKLP